MTCSHDWSSRLPHCRKCCLTFTGITAFDKHILFGEHCPPSERGLVEVRPGIYGAPSTEAGERYWQARRQEHAERSSE